MRTNQRVENMGLTTTLTNEALVLPIHQGFDQGRLGEEITKNAVHHNLIIFPQRRLFSFVKRILTYPY